MCDAGNESRENTRDGLRVVVVTSTLEDWLHRGTHPVMVSMSLQVYGMWVFRVEKSSGLTENRLRARHLDFDFAPHYALHATRTKRLATEFRVPLFEGCTMPTAKKDSETASMYKQLLLRPLSVLHTTEPEDVRLWNAFVPMSSDPSDTDLQRPWRAQTAFTRAWLTFLKEAEEEGRIAFARFLARHEWPSLWETEEVQQELFALYKLLVASEGGEALTKEQSMDPDHCPDKGKPRVTLKQYVSLVATEVAANLEGIALAREEKKPRQYQSDAAIHETFPSATAGGGFGGEEATEAAEGAGPSNEPPRELGLEHFPPLPWGILSHEEMTRVLDFKYRLRLTSFVKELLALSCMNQKAR